MGQSGVVLQIKAYREGIYGFLWPKKLDVLKDWIHFCYAKMGQNGRLYNKNLYSLRLDSFSSFAGKWSNMGELIRKAMIAEQSLCFYFFLKAEAKLRFSKK